MSDYYIMGYCMTVKQLDVPVPLNERPVSLTSRLGQDEKCTIHANSEGHSPVKQPLNGTKVEFLLLRH